MRAAVIHVIADAAVSVLVIGSAARPCVRMALDIAGACVIASWSFGLVRDTGAILLDMNPDPRLAVKLRQTIEGGRRQTRRPAAPSQSLRFWKARAKARFGSRSKAWPPHPAQT